MNPYTTPDTIRGVLDPDFDPNITEPDHVSQTAAALDDAQLLDAIGQATARVNSYIGARYQIPVSDADLAAEPQIGTITTDVAAYRATLTYSRSQPLDPTDPVALRYRDAMLDLVAIRDGKATLNVAPAIIGNVAEAGSSGIIDAGSLGLFDARDVGFGRVRSGSYYPGGYVPFPDRT